MIFIEFIQRTLESPANTFFLIVSIMAILASRWNITSGLLALNWIGGQAAWMQTGDRVPLTAYWVLDVTVVAIIMVRRPREAIMPPQSFSGQLVTAWRERRPSDRIVITLFGVAWLFYIAPISDDSRWWPLAIILLGQFAAAFRGAWRTRASTRAGRHLSEPDTNGVLRLAWGGGGG